MTEYSIVPATGEHSRLLAERIRPEDAAEAWAACHLRPLDALEQSRAASRDTWTGLADGKVLCMLGVVERGAYRQIGIPWMLGSHDLPEHPRVFLRASRNYVRAIRQEYKILENYVDSRHEKAVKWLRWLGFRIHAPEPYGPDGAPFHKFDIRTGE